MPLFCKMKNAPEKAHRVRSVRARRTSSVLRRGAGRRERRVFAGGKPAFTFSVCFSFRRAKQSGAYQPVAAALDALCDELSALLFVMRNCDKCDVLPKERH